MRIERFKGKDLRNRLGQGSIDASAMFLALRSQVECMEPAPDVTIDTLLKLQRALVQIGTSSRLPRSLAASGQPTTSGSRLERSLKVAIVDRTSWNGHRSGVVRAIDRFPRAGCRSAAGRAPAYPDPAW